MALAMQRSLCSSRQVSSSRSTATSCQFNCVRVFTTRTARRPRVATAAAAGAPNNINKQAKKTLVNPVCREIIPETISDVGSAPFSGLKQSQVGACIGAAAAVQAYLQLLTGGPEGSAVAVGIAAVAASVAFPVAAANITRAVQTLVLTVLTTVKPNSAPRARQAATGTMPKKSHTICSGAQPQIVKVPEIPVPVSESLKSKLPPGWDPRDLTTLAYGPLPVPDSTANSAANSTVKLPKGWGPRDLTTLAFEGYTPIPVYATLSTAPQDTSAAAADMEVSSTAVQYDDVIAPLPPSPILATYAPTTPLMLTKTLPLDSLAPEPKTVEISRPVNSIFKFAPTAEGLAHAAAQLAKVVPSDHRTGLAAICVSNNEAGYFNPSNGKFCGGRIANVGAVKRAQGSVARFLAGANGRTAEGVELPRVNIKAGTSFGSILAREWDSLKVYVITPADYHLQGGKKLTYGDLVVHAAYGIPMPSGSGGSSGSKGSDVQSSIVSSAAVSRVGVSKSPVGAAAAASSVLSSAAAEDAVTGVSSAAVAAAKRASSMLLRVAKALPRFITSAASSIASRVSGAAAFSHSGLGVSTYSPVQLGH